MIESAVGTGLKANLNRDQNSLVTEEIALVTRAIAALNGKRVRVDAPNLAMYRKLISVGGQVFDRPCSFFFELEDETSISIKLDTFRNQKPGYSLCYKTPAGSFVVGRPHHSLKDAVVPFHGYDVSTGTIDTVSDGPNFMYFHPSRELQGKGVASFALEEPVVIELAKAISRRLGPLIAKLSEERSCQSRINQEARINEIERTIGSLLAISGDVL